MQLLRRIVDIDRRQRRIPYQRKRLVVRRDQHIHMRPLRLVHRQRNRPPAQRHAGLHVPQHHDQDRVRLGRDQDQHQHGIDRQPVIGLVRKEQRDHPDAPPPVAQRRRQREQHQRNRDDLGFRGLVQQDRDRHADAADQDLLRPAQVQAHELKQKKEANARHNKAEGAGDQALRTKKTLHHSNSLPVSKAVNTLIVGYPRKSPGEPYLYIDMQSAAPIKGLLAGQILILRGLTSFLLVFASK